MQLTNMYHFLNINLTLHVAIFYTLADLHTHTKKRNVELS